MPTGCRSVYLYVLTMCSCAMWGSRRAPACDLERRAEDLGAHKLSHDGLLLSGFCDRRRDGDFGGAKEVVVVLEGSV